MGSSIGFLFPVCECGNVPVARRLLMQGVPAPAAIGFLVAAPTINPVVIWATWTAFRDQPEIVVLRVVFSLSIATIIGWVFSAQKDLRPLLQPSVARAIPLPKPEFSEKDLVQANTQLLLQSGTFMLGQPGGRCRSNLCYKTTGSDYKQAKQKKPRNVPPCSTAFLKSVCAYF